MTDIVIPLGWGSKWGNFELKYCLRSFEKYLSGIGKIIIVTDLSGLPGWIQNVIHIPFPDYTSIPQINSTYKIVEACKDKRTSQNFLLSSDDFFLLSPFDAANFPTYHKGDIKYNATNVGHTSYTRGVRNTAQTLLRTGHTIKSYEMHCPMNIDKTNLLEVLNQFDWKNGNGLLPRSLYGNVLSIGGEQREDYIVNLPLNLTSPLKNNDFFSIQDGNINGEMEALFEKLYPEKSQWEK